MSGEKGKAPSSLLLEIGTEEVPARFIPGAQQQLGGLASSLLKEYSVEFSTVRTFATPRRLALIVEGISPMQKDSTSEVYGPPKKAAFDEKGNPTKAAVGFAQSQGVDVLTLVVKKKDKGEYVVAIREQKGVAVRKILPEVLERLIRALHFPKSMRWGDGSLRFVRPIHWILALCDGEVVPFEIDGIRSGNITRGHRFLSPGAFVMKEIPTYPHLMENNYVLVDPERRRKVISEGIANLSRSVGGLPVADEELLDTVLYLTEYPVPFLCQFPAEYLRLPKELLVMVMRDHQKFFAVEDDRGDLKNAFIVIGNTKEENAVTVKTGAERVIKARFEDARFYFAEDSARTLSARIDDLKRVTFHDRLGSLYDKTEKVVRLASFLAERLFPGRKEIIERAARLSKTDLVTGVVGEFPELQGLMGKYYALNDGEDRAVAEALREQYLPPHSGGRLPETDEGSIISLADKMDNVVSFFSIGLAPTGSEDPLALRRQTLAIIAILIDKGYPITLRELIAKAGENPAKRGTAQSRETRDLSDEVLGFFLPRIEAVFSSEGYSADVIQSVLHLLGDQPLAETTGRLRAIQGFTAEREYNALLLSLKRINNIIPKAEMPAVAEGLLLEPEEKGLFQAFSAARPLIQGMLRERKYGDALKSLSALTEPINTFFDRVLVMDKREEVKMNRLALLREIWDTALSLADFSKLTERQPS